MSWKPLFRVLQSLVTAMICLAAFSACQTNTVPSGSYYIVSAPKTAFYKFGPAQSFGPDFSLEEGAKIIMLEHSFGYSRVMTADGTSGFVSTDDVKPAPPGTFTTSPKAKSNYTLQLNRPMFDAPSHVEKHSNVPPTRGGSPLFDTGDTPLPQNDPAKPAPNFHF
jgi:hypothetical protein